MNLNSHDITKNGHYDGLSHDIENSNWIFFGAPFDGTSSYRAGSRFAPEAIRQETVLCQETFSTYFETELEEISISDIGNLNFPFGNTEKSLNQISSLTSDILATNKYPFMVGGEHLVSLPVVSELYKKYPDLRIIHLDAHADMADDLFGEKLSHGTVMRRIWDFLGDKKIYQYGIRSASKEEFSFSREHNIMNPFNLDGIEQHIPELEKYPIYFTIDLDCFDPSQIPGTGTPETGGVFFNEFIQFLHKIKHLNFVGIDVTELAPRIDPTSMSTVFASKVQKISKTASFVGKGTPEPLIFLSISIPFHLGAPEVHFLAKSALFP